jgi:hypothetical protein
MNEFIVCLRANIKTTVPNCMIEKCSKCDTKIWVAPATRQSIKEGVYKGDFLCMDCFVEGD